MSITKVTRKYIDVPGIKGEDIANISARDMNTIVESLNTLIDEIESGGESALYDNVVYVDASAADATGDGSATAPFKTYAQLVVAMNAAPTEDWWINVSGDPGDDFALTGTFTGTVVFKGDGKYLSTLTNMTIEGTLSSLFIMDMRLDGIPGSDDAAKYFDAVVISGCIIDNGHNAATRLRTQSYCYIFDSHLTTVAGGTQAHNIEPPSDGVGILKVINCTASDEVEIDADTSGKAWASGFVFQYSGGTGGIGIRATTTIHMYGVQTRSIVARGETTADILLQGCNADSANIVEAGSFNSSGHQGCKIQDLPSSSAPASTNDSSQGYWYGSQWLTSNGDVWTCIDPTEDAAVWVRQPAVISRVDFVPTGTNILGSSASTILAEAEGTNDTDAVVRFPLSALGIFYGSSETDIEAITISVVLNGGTSPRWWTGTVKDALANPDVVIPNGDLSGLSGSPGDLAANILIDDGVYPEREMDRGTVTISVGDPAGILAGP